MRRSFTLSHAAIDILCEQLRLDPSPFPFEIPRHGQTDQQRAGIRAAVFADLETRELAYRGRTEGDVEEIVSLFSRPNIVITVFGQLDKGQRLFARICSNDRQAVQAIGVDNGVRFEPLHPASLISATVGLLPNAPAGHGQSVTFALDAPPKPAEDREEGIFRMVRAPRDTATVNADAAQTMLGQPRLRFGSLKPVVRGPNGRLADGSDLFWFDTPTGRYVTHKSTAHDGRAWVTFSPIDTPRLGKLLETTLNRLTQE
jgi:hypothetical protein